ncbi:hypothetical protein L3X38_027908 [Prunus dulcis]|uniref:Uncharacterized protein n=1 Tax=Prunus dulcis TaxID=3755 RepID=A0AAD4VPP0_PRUDU|nr:hypothetical protein L3X38_027908 [Prunus dulcis]
MLLALTTLSSGIFILQPKSTTVEEGESCDQGLSCSHRHQGGNHSTLPATWMKTDDFVVREIGLIGSLVWISRKRTCTLAQHTIKLRLFLHQFSHDDS